MISAPTSTSTPTENWNTSRKKNWIRYMWSRWKLHGNVGINTPSKEVFRPKNLWNWLVPSFSVLFCFCVGSRLMGKNGACSFLPFYFLVFFFPMGLWLQQCWCACFDQITRQTLNISREKPTIFMPYWFDSPLPPPPSPLLLQSLPSNLLLLIGDSSKKRPY